MSSTLAIQTNNVGVDLFEVGLLELAISKFETAVNQMTTLLLSDNDPQQFSLPPDASEQVQYHQPILGWSRPSPMQGRPGLHIYTRAAYLQPKFSPFGISTYTAVPLFNLGLAYHMKALRDGSASLLAYSSKVYESVMMSLEASRPYDDTNILLLHLGLFTNCGHILSQQKHQWDNNNNNNDDNAMKCIGTSCRILAWLYLRNAAHSVLDESEVQGIMNNMEILHKICQSTNSNYMDLGLGAAAA